VGSTGYWAEARVIDVFGIIDPVTAHLSPRNFGKGMAGHEKRAESRLHTEQSAGRDHPGYYFSGHWATATISTRRSGRRTGRSVRRDELAETGARWFARRPRLRCRL
jgi:hypothetical protein